MGMANKLIIAFVALMLGAVLIGTIATSATDVTEKTIVTDEAVDITNAWINATTINNSYEFTITNNPTTWKVSDCPISSVTFGNSSTDYTVTTDYTLTTTSGILVVEDTAKVREGGNDTVIDYTYCGDDYMNVSWGRTVTELVAGFFAIALLLTAVGLFYSVAKDTGVI